ncbi:hypothetical protein [uncultured Rhodospira sp.]|uniref:hypothetical protein n=1 Tax=uncultured Rhodospira sp. TaxID=1936189 RepID=UPI00261EB65C|nr:hypothetical protein [uncultured Rhodospira sp.]
MATSTSNVGPVASTPSISSRATAVRASQGGRGEGDGSIGFVEAITGATPTRARTADDHAAMEDLWSGAERQRDALAGKSDDDRGAAEDAPRFVLTPYRITDSATRSGAVGLRDLSPPIRSEIVRAVDVYDRAIQAVTNTQPRDLLGQRLDRRF